MQFGASTFIWASPFSNATLDLVDKVADLGFDLIEVCVEDPATIDTAAILPHLKSAGIGATVCGAFGPDRDMSADDPAVRKNALAYVKRCIDIAAELEAKVVVGPMYSAVGRTRMAEVSERTAQRALAANSIREAAKYAATRGVSLGVEPLNRFETDLSHRRAGHRPARRDRREERRAPPRHLPHEHRGERPSKAIARAAGRITEFHARSSDRGTPGEDHIDWRGIVKALAAGAFEGPVVIEAFTPKIKEIARAVSIWRPLAESEDALASNGLAHLKRVFA